MECCEKTVAELGPLRHVLARYLGHGSLQRHGKNVPNSNFETRIDALQDNAEPGPLGHVLAAYLGHGLLQLKAAATECNGFQGFEAEGVAKTCQIAVWKGHRTSFAERVASLGRSDMSWQGTWAMIRCN